MQGQRRERTAQVAPMSCKDACGRIAGRCRRCREPSRAGGGTRKARWLWPLTFRWRTSITSQVARQEQCCLLTGLKQQPSAVGRSSQMTPPGPGDAVSGRRPMSAAEQASDAGGTCIDGPQRVVHCRPRMSAIRRLNLGVSFPAVRLRGRPALADPQESFAADKTSRSLLQRLTRTLHAVFNDCGRREPHRNRRRHQPTDPVIEPAHSSSAPLRGWRVSRHGRQRWPRRCPP